MAAPTQGIPRQLAHVALRVRDLDRAVDFYTNVVGLKLKNRRGNGAFLGVREDLSHELALFPLPETAADPDPEQVGMYHAAWIMDSFEELERIHERLLASGTRITGYSDSSCNVMFLDPDGNELEAVWEMPHGMRERALAPGGPGLPRLKR